MCYQTMSSKEIQTTISAVLRTQAHSQQAKEEVARCFHMNHMEPLGEKSGLNTV